jgi:hypothetical protein
VPGASGGGRAPAGLGFGRCGRIGSGGHWWIRRSTERGGPQGSRRRRGGLADCALGTVGGTSLVPHCHCYYSDVGKVVGRLWALAGGCIGPMSHVEY